jgi:hypothetical protein
VAVGNTILTEQIALPREAAAVWPQRGTARPRDVHRDPPTRASASHGRHRRARVSKHATRLSQFCHGGTRACAETVVAALAPRSLWHRADPA